MLRSGPRGCRRAPSKAAREEKGNGTWGTLYLHSGAPSALSQLVAPVRRRHGPLQPACCWQTSGRSHSTADILRSLGVCAARAARSTNAQAVHHARHQEPHLTALRSQRSLMTTPLRPASCLALAAASFFLHAVVHPLMMWMCC